MAAGSVDTVRMGVVLIADAARTGISGLAACRLCREIWPARGARVLPGKGDACGHHAG